MIALALPLSVLTLALSDVTASSPAPEPEAPMQAVEQALDYLDAFQLEVADVAHHDRMVGFAAAILENGEPVAIYTSGETVRGSGEAVTADTVFRLASVSKTFAGTMLGLLDEAGLVSLDARVPTSVLDLSGPRQPTWRELASHQTGLPPNAYDNLIEAGQDAHTVRARLAEVPLLCRTGGCYTYQNVAFDAVRDLVEDATGLSYPEAVQTYLFDPLGMESAGFGAENLARADSYAAPHFGRRQRLGGTATDYDTLPAAAGVSLSLNDLIIWAQAQMDPEGYGLSPRAVERAHTPQTRSLRETRNLRRLGRVQDTSYGLGWRIYDWQGERTLIVHGGALAGYGSQVVLEPETGFAFVALWNADVGLPRLLWPTAMDMRTGDGPGAFVDDAIARMR
ncbi:serine hydrolase domain-containing protein [Oceanicaulis sp.]|uniref:serine hydrolase domain-containing protein n=1 Tax=Oceanicaulis sp. TaxID=1924941 RepID=UPI003F7080AA